MSLYIRKFIDCPILRGNPNTNFGHGVIMMCQCRLAIVTNVSLVLDVDGVGGSIYVGAGGIRKISVPSAMNPKLL